MWKAERVRFAVRLFTSALFLLCWSCAGGNGPANNASKRTNENIEPTFGFAPDSDKLRRLDTGAAKALLVAIIQLGSTHGHFPTLRDFSVGKDADGYWTVMLEFGMWDGDKLIAFPSGFSVVKIRPDWTVESVVGGA